jgi:hypothetical protein
LDPNPADAVHPVLSWHNKEPREFFVVNLFNNVVSNSEGQRPKAFENRMLRRILGLKRVEIT